MPRETAFESPRPHAPGVVKERAARRARIAIAVASLALASHCLLVGNGKAGSVLLFWMGSFYVFPSLHFTQQLRQNQYAIVGVLVVAIIQIGVGLFGLADRVAAMRGLVFMGVMLALGSCGNLLRVRAAPSAASSVARSLLCAASLLSGAVWLWLEIQSA